MPLDPAIAAATAALRDQGFPPLTRLTPEQARAGGAQLSDTSDNPRLAPVGAVQDTSVDGADGPLPARVYRPAEGQGHPGWSDGARPTLVWFHGGGWVIGSIESRDLPVREIVGRTGAVVVSVEYRLAPEHPFPAAVDDALAATRWAVAHAGELGGDPARVAVGGDSAGGNLAAVVCQQLRSAGGPALAAQLLVYPATDMVGEHPSRAENADAPELTPDDMDWFGRHYVADPTEAALADPRVSPLLATDFAGLPPAVVATAQYDPLRDEGVAYADALRAGGVRVIARTSPGLVHGFIGWTTVSPAARAALTQISDDLVAVLTG